MTDIVGILPMAGTGSRLGLPFHKSLAPSFDGDAIIAIWHHSLERMRIICNKIYAVTPAKDNVDMALLHDLALNGVQIVPKNEQGELPTSLSFLADRLEPDDLVAVSLPDSIWQPFTGFVKLMNAMFYARQREEKELALPIDGFLGIFNGDNRVLDEVILGDAFEDELVKEIKLHAKEGDPYRKVTGWGIMLVKAKVLQNLTDDKPLATQLMAHRLGWVRLDGPYNDLGTTERYRNYLRREA